MNKYWIILLSLALPVSGCGPIVIPTDRHWVFSTSSDDPNPKATAERQHREFSIALRDCVSLYDPDHLADIDAGREYYINSWPFRKKENSVLDCMSQKGFRTVEVGL
jgi:hypothetical protein